MRRGGFKKWGLFKKKTSIRSKNLILLKWTQFVNHHNLRAPWGIHTLLKIRAFIFNRWLISHQMKIRAYLTSKF